jgi:hypothetical protein
LETGWRGWQVKGQPKCKIWMISNGKAGRMSKFEWKMAQKFFNILMAYLFSFDTFARSLMD